MPHDNQDVGEARQLGEERLVSLDGEVRDVRKRLDLQWCQVMTLHEKLPNTCDRTLAGSASPPEESRSLFPCGQDETATA